MTRIPGNPSRAEILEQRNRIAASEVFATSQRMTAFLDYLINETLDGRAERLKEFAIGIAVFGRDADFDPRIDAIVRVEASRLRSKLREYFAEAGADDPVRITIPKGAYVPLIEFRPRPAVSEPRGRLPPVGRRFLIASLITATVAVAVASVLTWGPWRRDASAVPSSDARSLAVLPLRDWSPDRPDYFSEAMTDVLIARLSERGDLRVTSLGSVMAYRNSGLSPVELAERLRVKSIVEGAVLREGSNVRITATLIDGSDGRNVWSKTFTRPMSSILALQEEVAAEIAAQLAGRLLPSVRPVTPRVDPAAYEAYLKGVYWRNRPTEQGFNRGIVFFQEAIGLQADYAEAYAGLAACHCQLGGYGIEVVTPRAALPEALSMAMKANELDDSLAEPYAVIGIIKFKFEWDPEAAEFYLERAIEKNPSLFEAYLWRSQIAEGMGRTEFALEQARLAHRLNPLSLAGNLNLGWQLFRAGRVAEADGEFDMLIESEPNFWGGHWGKGHSHRARGAFDAAVTEFTRAVELADGHSLPAASLGYTYALAGDIGAAQTILRQLETASAQTYVSPVHIAMVYAGLGNRDAAFEWLDRGFQARARSMAWLTAIDEFQGLHQDPRFEKLVYAIGIAKRKSSAAEP